MSLSVVLATFNEEKNIKRCLESIRDIASEIVIVDGTSSDKTVQIAKEYTDNITVTNNPKIFHINKQKAIDKATQKWILQLDADEVVSNELAEEIKNIVAKPGEFNGYWIPRKNWFLGRFLLKGGQYPDYTVRLYKKGKARLPQKDVHEQAEVEGSVGYLKHALLHYPYKDFSAYFMKWKRYNTIFSDQISVELQHKNFLQKIVYGIAYLMIKPASWFLLTFFRHKGFLDFWPGFVFSLFSALRFPVSYTQYLRKHPPYTTPLFFVLGIPILLLGLLLRSRMFFSGDFFYLVDQARDLMLIREIAQGDIALIGARAGIGGIFHGPLWLYMNVPLFLVTRGDPFFTLIPMFVGVSLAIIVSGFFLGWKLYDRCTGFVFGILLSISSLYVTTVLLTTNAQVMPLVFVWYILSILLFLRGSNKALVASSFFVGLGFQFESAFAVMLIPITFFAILLRWKKVSFQTILLSIGAFLLAVASFIVFELRNSFLMTRSALSLLQGGVKPLKGFEQYSDMGFRVVDRFDAYIESLHAPFFTSSTSTMIILLLVLLCAFGLFVREIIHTKKISSENKEYLFVLLTPIFIFILYILYPFPLWEHYILPVGIITILYFVLSLRKIYQKPFGEIILALVMLILLKPAVLSAYNQYIVHPYPKNISDGSYQNQLAVVDSVLKDANGENFGYFVYMPGIFTYNMDYLLWWKSKEYKSLIAAEKKPLTYLIMYPAANQNAHEFWKEHVLHTQKQPISNYTYTGGIKVEKLNLSGSEPAVDPNYFMNLHFR
jgi:glycosyltransferase involved in cell wall biosynthesis